MHFLDPRLGLNYYNVAPAPDQGNENTDVIFAAVNDVYQKYYAPNTTTPVVEVRKKFSVFPKLKLNDELRSFTQRSSDMQGGSSEDVLSWWKAHSKTYPHLSKMARDYLSIPATSTSSERLFSSGKHLITDSRNLLSAETIQACQCLKSWIKYPSNPEKV